MISAGEAAGSPIPRMYYGSFDTTITAKYGVVCERWPLPKFVSPADLKTRNEVEILFHAWSTNTTTFRRLTTTELDEWQQQRFQDALDIQLRGRDDGDGDRMDDDGSETQPLPTLTSSSSSSPAPIFVMHNPSSQTSQPTAVNTVTSANDQPIVSAKKPRKTRCDAGVKRGPRGKANTASS